MSKKKKKPYFVECGESKLLVYATTKENAYLKGFELCDKTPEKVQRAPNGHGN